MTPRYRPDIDGLRAVAVVGVVLYHAGVPGLTGGFVGVDVFFVISGFLITGLLAEEVRQERFSMLGFYDRRMRRLLPALLSVLATSTGAALLMLPPGELTSYARTLVSTLSFWSNIRFWLDTDYFGAPASAKPLLHTWSLAVEEQFYLIWPPLLALLLRRWPHRAAGALGGLTLASLALAQWQVWHEPEAAFYLLPARVCELGIGAVCAVLPPQRVGRTTRAAGGLLGLAAIVGAMLWLDASSPFPGLSAMLPCLGTAAVIMAGSDTPSSRLLGWRPVVAVGLASYSLYLWHWPILVFGRLALGRDRTPGETVAFLAVAALLATLSWRFVERPFRGTAGPPLRIGALAMPRGVALGVPLLALGLAAGGALVSDRGWPRRRPDVAAAEAALRDQDPLRLGKACLDAARNPAQERCTYGSGPVEALAWGDSHAGAVAPMLKRIADAQRFSVLEWGQSGCPPLIDVDLVRDRRVDLLCRRANEGVMALLDRRPDIRTVVLAGRWSLYAETRRPAAEADERAFLIDAADDALTIENSRRVLAAGLARTLARLTASGHRILIVQQAPEFTADPGTCALQALWWKRPAACRELAAPVLARLAASRHIIDAAASGNPAVSVFDPLPHLCDAATCEAVRDGVALYRDFDHLTRAGAERLAPFIHWPTTDESQCASLSVDQGEPCHTR